MKAGDIKPRHFRWELADRVATITLDRPERKNPLTLESYRELTDTFVALNRVDDVKAIVLTGADGNFCSGGDVHDIIGPLVEMKRAGDRTRSTSGAYRTTGCEGLSVPLRPPPPFM